MDLLRRLRQMIRLAAVSLDDAEDTATYPQAQISHHGLAAVVQRFSPYGLSSNPPTSALAPGGSSGVSGAMDGTVPAITSPARSAAALRACPGRQITAALPRKGRSAAVARRS